MRSPQESAEDQQLRVALRGADPARSLEPLNSEWKRQRAREIMKNTEQSPQPVQPATRPVRGRRWVLLGTAGAGVLAAGAAAVLLTGANGGAVSRFTVPDTDISASCAVITPEALAARETAFAARVTDVKDGTVTLEVTERFKGDVDDSVEVPQPGDAALSEFGPSSFVQGAAYLVTADGGVVSSCGQSGPESPELRALYRAAFPS